MVVELQRLTASPLHWLILNRKKTQLQQSPPSHRKLLLNNSQHAQPLLPQLQPQLPLFWAHFPPWPVAPTHSSQEANCPQSMPALVTSILLWTRRPQRPLLQSSLRMELKSLFKNSKMKRKKNMKKINTKRKKKTVISMQTNYWIWLIIRTRGNSSQLWHRHRRLL